MEKKQISTWALAAKQMRKELKAAYPNIKFQIKSDSFANGTSVDVRWVDGVTTEQVEKIVDKYQYGKWDGMTDTYNYNNKLGNIAQVKYVQTERELSREVLIKAADVIAKDTNQEPKGLHERFYDERRGNYTTFYDYAYIALRSIDLTYYNDIKMIHNFSSFTNNNYMAYDINKCEANK